MTAKKNTESSGKLKLKISYSDIIEKIEQLNSRIAKYKQQIATETNEYLKEKDKSILKKLESEREEYSRKDSNKISDVELISPIKQEHTEDKIITVSEFALCKREIIKFFNNQNVDKVNFNKKLIKSLIKETPVFINGVAEKKIKAKESAFYEFWTIQLLAQASAMFVKNNYHKIRYAKKQKNIYSYNNIDSILNVEDESTFKLAISHILSYWEMFFDLGQGDIRAYKKAMSGRNAENPRLQPEDEPYKIYMAIVKEIVMERKKKSKVIHNFCKNDGEKDLPTEKRKFDSFCKTHKPGIRTKFSLTKKKFRDFLFPRTSLKKLFPNRTHT